VKKVKKVRVEQARRRQVGEIAKCCITGNSQTKDDDVRTNRSNEPFLDTQFETVSGGGRGGGGEEVDQVAN
jgi:hypothetical protein